MSDNLSSNANFFVDDTSIFSVFHAVGISVKELNDDLKKINEGLLNGKWDSILI